MILPYSGIELQSREGLKHLCRFAASNNCRNKSVKDAIEHLIDVEETIALECQEDYYDTLRSAMPNPWD